MRTVYLGTSPFAAAVLERLAASPHRPGLVVTRPDRPRGRGRALQSPAVAATARELGLELIQPEALHAPDVLDRIAAARPDALVVCAYGVLISEPLLSDYEVVNVHPSLLPRWRGAAPVERAIMAGDAETGVSIMRLTEGLDEGPVCLQGTVPIAPDDDYGTLSARLQELSGELLVRALDERPPWVEQDADGVTYAHKIEAADRALDPTRTPEEVERTVRALRPHIGARLPLPDGGFLGVVAARVPSPPIPTLAPAGGPRAHRRRAAAARLPRRRARADRGPAAGRAADARAGVAARPAGSRADRLLARPATARQAARRARARARSRSGTPATSGRRTSPRSAGAARPTCSRRSRRSPRIPTRARAASRPTWRASSARRCGRCRPSPRRCSRRWASARSIPRVLAVIAEALGHLGEPWGLSWLLRLRRHPDAGVRDGVVSALAGRTNPLATDALIELSVDPDPAIRDWATFALGALAPQDSPALRDALAARLEDADPEARIEAVHGLALRGDARAVEPALELLERG